MPSSLHNPRYEKLIEKLREAREEAGLTQIDAAIRLGKPQSWVSRCETKQRRVDLVELEDFAVLYKKPLRFFQTRKLPAR